MLLHNKVIEATKQEAKRNSQERTTHISMPDHLTGHGMPIMVLQLRGEFGYCEEIQFKLGS